MKKKKYSILHTFVIVQNIIFGYIFLPLNFNQAQSVLIQVDLNEDIRCSSVEFSINLGNCSSV